MAIGVCKVHGLYCAPTMVCPKCPPPSTEAEKPKAKSVICGLDLAKVHDYSALVGLEVCDHVAKIVLIKPWPHVNYEVVVADTVKIYKKLEARILAIDATGVGEPISEMLTREGVKVEDIKFGSYVEYTQPWGDRERAPVKYAMMEYARACLQHDPPRVVFPAHGAEELIQQLKEQELIVGPTDRPTYAHPDGRHDDLAWAFLMALYVARTWITGPGTWVYRIS
jgi:hypothetical protein